MASYTTALALALGQAPEGRMTLRELYAFVEAHAALLPFTTRAHWRRSVRHTLSKQPCFSRVDGHGAPAEASARRCLWVMNEPRLPAPTREVLRAQRRGLALDTLFRQQLETCGAATAAAAAVATAARHAPAPAPAAALDPHASAASAASAVARRGALPPQAPLTGAGAPALVAALLNGISGNVEPRLGAAHPAAPAPAAEAGLLSGWAALAGFSAEEVEAALAAATAAARAAEQQQQQQQQQQQRDAVFQPNSGARLQQYQQAKVAAQRQLPAAHHAAPHQPGLFAAPPPAAAPAAQPPASDASHFYQLIMQSLGAGAGAGNADSLRAAAAATAEMASTPQALPAGFDQAIARYQDAQANPKCDSGLGMDEGGAYSGQQQLQDVEDARRLSDLLLQGHAGLGGLFGGDHALPSAGADGDAFHF